MLDDGRWSSSRFSAKATPEVPASASSLIAGQDKYGLERWYPKRAAPVPPIIRFTNCKMVPGRT